MKGATDPDEYCAQSVEPPKMAEYPGADSFVPLHRHVIERAEQTEGCQAARSRGTYRSRPRTKIPTPVADEHQKYRERKPCGKSFPLCTSPQQRNKDGDKDGEVEPRKEVEESTEERARKPRTSSRNEEGVHDEGQRGTWGQAHKTLVFDRDCCASAVLGFVSPCACPFRACLSVALE